MNSSGNIIGIIPKNFIIVLIENHHWVDVNKLDSQQRQKLPKMFRRSTSDLSAEMGPQAYQDDSWFKEEPTREEAKDNMLLRVDDANRSNRKIVDNSFDER